MNWYYVEAGQQCGPLDDDALNALAASGRITPETLIWKEGMANWQPYRELKPAGLTLAGAAAGVGAPPMASTGTPEAVCAECKGFFPIDDTIQVGNARVCANCKPIFVQKLSEGLKVNAVHSFRYAGFWIRFAAKFLDLLIIGIVIFIPAFMMLFGARNNPGAYFGMQLTLQLGSVFVMVLYSGFFLGKYGATPGKMVCQIKVVNAEGGKIGYGLSFGRSLGEVLSRMICCIGYIMVAFDSEKRSLHDRMCNTRVIYK